MTRTVQRWTAKPEATSSTPPPFGLARPVLAIYQGMPACGPTFHAQADQELLAAAGVSTGHLSRDTVRQALQALPGHPAPTSDDITAAHLTGLRSLLASGNLLVFVDDPDRDPGLMTAWDALATQAGAQLHITACYRC